MDTTDPPTTEASDGVTADTSDPETVIVTLDDTEHVLDRRAAVALRDALGDALHRTTEFVHTVGEHRPDGQYAVRRRRADSSGHSKVFDSFEALVAAYEILPEEFTATDIEAASGGRRHMLLRHFTEHPAFDCELASKQPLTGRKRPSKPLARDLIERDTTRSPAPTGDSVRSDPDNQEVSAD